MAQERSRSEAQIRTENFHTLTRKLPPEIQKLKNDEFPSKASLHVLDMFAALRPDFPVLETTYKALTGLLQDDAPPFARLSAAIIGDIIIHRTDPKRSLEDKFIVVDPLTADRDFALLRMIVDTSPKMYPATRESGQTQRRFDKAQSAFVATMDSITTVPPTSQAEAKTQLGYLDTMYRMQSDPSTSLFNKLETMGSQAMKDRINALLNNKAVVTNAFAEELLVSGEIDTSDARLKTRIFAERMRRTYYLLSCHDELGQPDIEEAIAVFTEAMLLLRDPHEVRKTIMDNLGDISLDEQQQGRLAQYFLTQPDMQTTYWTGMSTHSAVDNLLSVPEEYSICKWYFAQDDPSVLSAFLETTGITQNTLTPEAKTNLLQKLICCAALFQKTYPDHSNVQHLRNSLQHFAAEADLLPATETSLQILRDERLGSLSVTTDDQGKMSIRTYTPTPGQTDMDFRISQQGDLYIS